MKQKHIIIQWTPKGNNNLLKFIIEAVKTRKNIIIWNKDIKHNVIKNKWVIIFDEAKLYFNNK